MSRFFRDLYHDLRAMPPPVWFLLAGQFINRFGAFVYPFLTLVLSARGFGPGQIALVLAAMSAGHFLGPVASGYLSDAIGRRNTIAIALLGSAATLILLYHVEMLALVAIVALLHGFLSFLFGPATAALLTDLVPEDKRVTAFALLRLAVNSGFAAGPTVAGLLYVHAPILVFYGDAFTTLVFAFIAWRWLPHGLRTIEGRASSARVAWKSWVEALSDMRANGPYLQFLGVVVFIGIAFNQVFNVLVLTATDRGLRPEVYGLLMGMNGLLIAVVELPLSHWARRFRPRRVLAVGYAFIGGGCLALGGARDAPEFFAAMVIFTFGEILALPIGMAYSSSLAPARFRGRYFGFRGMAWGCAGLFGSVGVWGYEELGSIWWIGVALCAFAAAGGILPSLRDHRACPAAIPATSPGIIKLAGR